MMKNYELTLLLSGQLSEDRVLTVCRQLSQEIAEKQGLISETGLIRRIELAYPIKKESVGWLQTTHFSLGKEKLPEIEKKIKSFKEGLRFLLLRKEASRLRPLPRFRPMSPAAGQDPKEPKVELKEIEKKLEEILQ